MLPRPPKATPTDTRLPSTTLFRASPTGPPTRLPPRRRPPRHRRRSRRSTTFRLRPSTPNDGRAMTSPLYLAIDTPHLDAAQTLAHKVRHHVGRSEEHTSELQSLMRTQYAVFCLKNKNKLLTT